jgi:hypothetical protein
MVGMMNKGGGSTNMPTGRFGGLTSKGQSDYSGAGAGGSGAPYSGPGGSGSPTLGTGGFGSGASAFGAGGSGNPGNSGVDLAALFRANAPAAPAGQPTTLATITQPRMPVIEPPPPRRPLTSTPTPEPATIPRFQSMAELLTFVHGNPGRLSDEQINSWKRALVRRVRQR